MIPYVPVSLCRLKSLPLNLLTHLYLCLLLSRLTPVLFELFLIFPARPSVGRSKCLDEKKSEQKEEQEEQRSIFNSSRG